MSYEAQAETARKELRGALRAFDEVGLEKFTRTAEDPALSFASHGEQVSTLIQLNRQLSKSNLAYLPGPVIEVAQECVTQSHDVLMRMMEFSVQRHGENWHHAKKELIEQLRAIVERYVGMMLPIIALAGAAEFTATAGEMRVRIAEALDEAVQESNSRREAMTSAHHEIIALLDSAKSTSQQFQAVEHAARFDVEAKNHERAAHWWLGATATLAAITVSLAIANVLWYVPKLDNITVPLSVQAGLAKLILFSFLASAVVWSGRVYRAHRHNVVVNQHRRNALSSFEAFALAANDAETKNAVLMQVTHSIFAPQSTGYNSHESESPASAQIIELHRSLSSGK